MTIQIRRYIKNKEIDILKHKYIIAFRNICKKEDRGILFSIYKLQGVSYHRIFTI